MSFSSAYEAVLTQWAAPVSVSDEDGTRSLSSGDGPPVVLLPGGGATAAVWFATALPGRRTIAYDLPGTAGFTTVAVTDAASLCGWLDQVLPAGPVDLVGHSYGGWVALTYALHAPERVRRLALLDPTNCFGGFAPAYLLHALPLLVRPTAERAAALIRWETGGRPLPAEWAALQAAAAEAPTTGKLVTGPKPAPERLRVPTLVVLGGRSRVHDVDKVSRRAMQTVPDARIVVLPDASHHSLPFDPAGEVNRSLGEFFG